MSQTIETELDQRAIIEGQVIGEPSAVSQFRAMLATVPLDTAVLIVAGREMHLTGRVTREGEYQSLPRYIPMGEEHQLSLYLQPSTDDCPILVRPRTMVLDDGRVYRIPYVLGHSTPDTLECQSYEREILRRGFYFDEKWRGDPKT